MGSTVNPFATGIASGIAGISISDGLLGRLVILIAGLAIGIFFVLRYADRVQQRPVQVGRVRAEGRERGALPGRERGRRDRSSPAPTSSILVVFALAFVVMIYGVIPWEDLGIPLPTLWWWFPEMTASFLVFSIIIGLIGRMREGELTATFVDGARDLLGVALIIGIARGITVIMNNGQITDTVLHWVETRPGRHRARPPSRSSCSGSSCRCRS